MPQLLSNSSGATFNYIKTLLTTDGVATRDQVRKQWKNFKINRVSGRFYGKTGKVEDLPM